jgi:hypothetical protein
LLLFEFSPNLISKLVLTFLVIVHLSKALLLEL